MRLSRHQGNSSKVFWRLTTTRSENANDVPWIHRHRHATPRGFGGRAPFHCFIRYKYLAELEPWLVPTTCERAYAPERLLHTCCGFRSKMGAASFIIPPKTEDRALTRSVRRQREDSRRRAMPEDRPLWDRLPLGPYAVGFQTRFQRDYARSYHLAFPECGRPPAPGQPRPLLVNLWYPAHTNVSAQPLCQGDYLRIQSSDAELAS